MGVNTHTHQRTQLTIVTNIIEREFVVTAILSLSKGYTKRRSAAFYKEWHRPMSKLFIKPPYFVTRATSIDSDWCRLPTASVSSNQADKLRSNQWRGKSISTTYILTRKRSYGTLRCKPQPFSFPFRTTTLGQHPSSSSVILQETTG